MTVISNPTKRPRLINSVVPVTPLFPLWLPPLDEADLVLSVVSDRLESKNKLLVLLFKGKCGKFLGRLNLKQDGPLVKREAWFSGETGVISKTRACSYLQSRRSSVCLFFICFYCCYFFTFVGMSTWNLNKFVLLLSQLQSDEITVLLPIWNRQRFRSFPALSCANFVTGTSSVKWLFNSEIIIFWSREWVGVSTVSGSQTILWWKHFFTASSS